MTKFFNKKCISFLLLVSIFLSSSCTNLKQKELASTDLIKSAENSIVEGKYRYIINKRSGKIHTYNHGMQIIENKDNILPSNESLEIILQDENKDLCRTCWAGIRTNLTSYDDNKLDTIEKFMRLYEFANIDIETQKFLICIFEVGEWYVDNVYTYQGGNQTVVETENIAKELASDSAYKRWETYLSNYSKLHVFRNESKVLPVLFDNKNKPSTLVAYKCDLFKNTNYYKDKKYDLITADNIIVGNEYKNNCVIDDCSKFAAAVYYYYINKELSHTSLSKEIENIDLWWTSSENFSNYNSFTKKIVNANKFELITLDDLNSTSYREANNEHNEYSFQPGDLIYRKGHVEFYVGNDSVVGWGRIHKNYSLKKSFHYENDGFHSNDPKDNNLPYTTIIRYIGGKNEKK